MHKHQRLNHYLWRPTTFFPELDVPVKMNETEEIPGPKQSSEAPSTSHSNYLLPGNYSENNDVRSKSDLNYQVDLLKRIKHEKERLSNIEDKSAYHYGFRVPNPLFCIFVPLIQHIFSVIFVMKNQLLEQDGTVRLAQTPQ